MKSKISRIFLALFIAGFLLASFSVVLALGPGDGNILRRGAGISGTPDELCHGCHKTYKNAPADTNAIKSHSSASTSKWPAGWGISTGQYGEIVCTTCHTGHDTANIYLIRETITAPNSPTNTFPGSTVDFRSKSGTAGDVGLMADDTACFLTQHTSQGACVGGGGVWNTTANACYAPNATLQADCTALSGTWTPRTTSTRVCEVCHSKNKYHNYNATNNPLNGGNFSHNNAGDCATCHPHAEGFLPAGGGACNACHGQSGSTGAPLITGDLVTGGNATGSVSSGKHQKHAVDLTYACTTCHTGYVMPDSSTHAIDIGFSIFGAGNGAYKGQSSPNVNYVGHNGTNVATKDNSRTCNTIYCHSNVQGVSGAGAPSQYASPAWNDTVQVMACSSCHVNMSTDGTGTGSHLKHANTTSGYGMTCANCHAGYTASTTNASTHVNHTIDVAVDATYGGTYSDGTVNGDKAPGGGYGSCSTVYCHSDGQATPVTYAGPSWGVTVNCGDCHGAVAATPPASAPHTKHVGTAGYKFSCSKCHDSVVNSTTDSTTTPTIKSTTLHVNKQREVALDAYNSGGSYVAGTGCSATYCHSQGTNIGASPYTQLATQAWTGNTTCVSCHTGGTASGPTYTSGSPKTNSHNKHVVTNSYVCVDCHSGTVNSSNAIIDTTKHTNKTYDVAGARITTYTYATDGGTCASACHGSATPKWGGSTTCSSCHDASNTGLSTRHDKHYNSATAATANNTTNSHTATEYVFGCGNCHPNTNHAKGAFSGVQDAEINGSKQTQANYSPALTNLTDTKGFKFTNYGSCTTVCHTRDGASAAPVVAATWGTTPTNTCTVCHMASGDNYNTMTVSANRLSERHAMHMATDRYSGNTLLGCSTCHNVTASSNTAINGIAGRNQHPNAVKNVDFNAATVGGTWSGTQCSNTYCHSNGTATSGTHGVITWAGAAGTLACSSCHGDATTLATGSHTKHIALSGVTCAYCHNATATGSTTINSYINHVNKNVTINFNASAAGSSGAYNGNTAGGGTVYQKGVQTTAGTCATTACHGGVSGTWGVADSNDTCTKCHGTPTLTVTVANRYVVAPPRDTAGQNGSATDTGQVSNDAQVGAHQTHLRYLNGLRSTANDTNDDRCGYCHGALPVSGLHANGSSTPAFQGLATHSGAMSATYSLGACNNTYCHNPAGTGGSLDTANAGTGIAPSWTNAAYTADGTLQTQTNCNKCHKVPGDVGFTSTFNHGAVVVGPGACTGCHGHSGDTTGAAGQRHIDATKYGGGSCNSCHGYEESSWATATQRAIEGKGAHAKHVKHLVGLWGGTLTPNGDAFGSGASWTNVCGVCHDGATHDMGEAIGGSGRQISVLASYQFGPTAPSYSGVPATSSSVNPKSCSNISCHFTATPVWSAY